MSDEPSPLSVAELLARNGQEVPSTGGGRRRRGGRGIAVTELTGELPAISEGGSAHAAPDPDPAPQAPAAAYDPLAPAGPSSAEPPRFGSAGGPRESTPYESKPYETPAFGVGSAESTPFDAAPYRPTSSGAASSGVMPFESRSGASHSADPSSYGAPAAADSPRRDPSGFGWQAHRGGTDPAADFDRRPAFPEPSSGGRRARRERLNALSDAVSLAELEGTSAAPPSTPTPAAGTAPATGGRRRRREADEQTVDVQPFQEQQPPNPPAPVGPPTMAWAPTRVPPTASPNPGPGSVVPGTIGPNGFGSGSAAPSGFGSGSAAPSGFGSGSAAPNGSTPGGNGPNGPGFNGFGSNAPGTGANGPSSNGSHSNGPGFNGFGPSAPGVGGAGPHGPGSNGPGLNGSAPSGLGSGTDAAQQPTTLLPRGARRGGPDGSQPQQLPAWSARRRPPPPAPAPGPSPAPAPGRPAPDEAGGAPTAVWSSLAGQDQQLISGQTVAGDLLRDAAARTRHPEPGRGVGPGRGAPDADDDDDDYYDEDDLLDDEYDDEDDDFDDREPRGARLLAAGSRFAARTRSAGRDSGGGRGGTRRAGAASERDHQRQWMILAGQVVGAAVVGMLLFKGFEKMWDIFPMVALALAMVVVLGLVALVRVLRRTDDLYSTVIAVIVGIFVTLGPLAFLLSTN